MIAQRALRLGLAEGAHHGDGVLAAEVVEVIVDRASAPMETRRPTVRGATDGVRRGSPKGDGQMRSLDRQGGKWLAGGDETEHRHVRPGFKAR